MVRVTKRELVVNIRLFTRLKSVTGLGIWMTSVPDNSFPNLPWHFKPYLTMLQQEGIMYVKESTVKNVYSTLTILSFVYFADSWTRWFVTPCRQPASYDVYKGTTMSASTFATAKKNIYHSHCLKGFGEDLNLGFLSNFD